MENNIEQNISEINNQMKIGFDSFIALAELGKEEHLATFIKILSDGTGH